LREGEFDESVVAAIERRTSSRETGMSKRLGICGVGMEAVWERGKGFGRGCVPKSRAVSPLSGKETCLDF
jgi:hypothetical protein